MAHYRPGTLCVTAATLASSHDITSSSTHQDMNITCHSWLLFRFNYLLRQILILQHQLTFCIDLADMFLCGILFCVCVSVSATLLICVLTYITGRLICVFNMYTNVHECARMYACCCVILGRCTGCAKSGSVNFIMT